ncbi:intraflagellar transport protein 57 homolog isoform X4 [Salvelinus fontinalis]|uniref:intraflagellar transport protein 57 homolog isoform X4 n=1 Tax=Salvelinus fontinalis TaxID=8038 RepID=UPI002486A8D8|nr:intraflagellar transport protein 57 homolog isoform X4 [Salvelinus fontinalis]
MVDDNRRGDDERGPGAAYQMFVVMEDLLDKLKLLDYEEEVLAKHNMKALSRHYFASSAYMPSNPGEQFFMFTIIASWLINAAGRPFEQPQEYDDPNATVSNILSQLRAFGGLVDFPPSKLKAGSGEHVCYVLDRLAEEALKERVFSWKRPNYPTEEMEEESVMEDDAELTLSKVEDEMTEEPDDYEEENVMDLEALKSRTNQSETRLSSKPDNILESNMDAAEWNLEVERVLPQLKVTIRTDHKDWRIHVDQMHQHKDGIKSSLKEAKGYLDKLQEEIGKTLEKVGSREKYINNQLEHLIQDYRSAQSKLSEARECYQQGSGGVTERTRVLAEITEELEKVKQEMEEKGSSMSDGAF